MSDGRIRALVYRPGQPAVVEEVEGFKGLQRLCGGFIERIVLEYTSKNGSRWLEMWMNEDGSTQHLPVNLYAEGPSYIGAPIFGTAVLCAGRQLPDDQASESLTDEEIAYWASAFKRASQPPVPVKR